VNYLLDTNVCIALINGTSDKVRARFAQATRSKSTLTTSVIVVHQLWHRSAKNELATRYARALTAFLSSGIEVLDYSEQDAQAAGEIRAELERQGQRIGEYDTLIAGQAFARNLILVTANTREFERVKGLVVEDWSI
jgi:tRNA(fMet)-specific endonuclease VapC